MCDKHVVKMILESAQMLSTAHYVLDNVSELFGVTLYKPTHRNHPSAVWVRQSDSHYQWLYKHFVALCHEYTKRFKKIHKTEEKLLKVLCYLPQKIESKLFYPPPQCLPDQYKTENTVNAYLNYYSQEKLFTNKDKERFYEQIKEQ